MSCLNSFIVVYRIHPLKLDRQYFLKYVRISINTGIMFSKLFSNSVFCIFSLCSQLVEGKLDSGKKACKLY